MNRSKSAPIKLKYRLYACLTCVAALSIFYVSWTVIYSLAQKFGIDNYASGTPGSSLNIYDYLVLLVLVLIFLLSFRLTIFIICKYKKWSYKQAVDYLFHNNNVPEHWLQK